MCIRIAGIPTSLTSLLKLPELMSFLREAAVSGTGGGGGGHSVVSATLRKRVFGRNTNGSRSHLH